MNSERIKPLWALLLFALALALLNRLNQYQVSQDPRHHIPFPVGVAESGIIPSDLLLAQAYQNRTSGTQLTSEGKITHIFPTADSGTDYQKFIVQLGIGQSILVMHNMELGAAIEGLAIGEYIEVYGEYQWTADGGIIRWTHQDPLGKHQAGWVKYKGRIYR